MKLSNHAKFKLEIYNIGDKEIIKACRKPIEDFYDVNEETYIKIIELDDMIFAVVYNKETQNIITVYRTDFKTISNRKKSKRWI